MRTVTRCINKKNGHWYLALLGYGFILSFQAISSMAYAAESSSVALPSSTTSSAATMAPVPPATTIAQATPPAVPNSVVPNSMSAPSVVEPLTPPIAEVSSPPHNETSTSHVSSQSLSSLENKVVDDAKDAVKKLSAASNQMSLEDLNTAKMALAKIDAIIDIEKRLSELEHIRNERTHTNDAPSVPQVAASSFQPPPLMTTVSRALPSVSQDLDAPPPPPPPKAEYTIDRIVGSPGHYLAVLSSNGQTKSVHVGDKLSNSVEVIEISPLGVTLNQDGHTRELTVKGVNQTYGRSL